MHIKPNFNLSPESATQKASEILKKAVGSQLISDVKLGSFLSAGIDSPLIADTASNILNNDLETYTVCLQDSKYDESELAKELAKKIKSHHKLSLIHI